MGCAVSQCDSAGGDECHHNITGWEEKKSKAYIKKKTLDQYLVCDSNGTRPLTKEDLEN